MVCTGLLVLALCSMGCQGLRLRFVNASVDSPSNVAVYFTVDTREGEPVPGLSAEQFHIYEDKNLISIYESKQTILNPEVATVRYTLLLLDMSGSVVESGQVPLIQEAVDVFIQGVGPQEKVAIYAFDGRETIQPITPFKKENRGLAGGTSRLSSWKTEDPSTNLNGAIVEAARIINETRESSDVPLRFGNLVVFTDGTDRAHRATPREAVGAVSDADISMYIIGLGGEVDQKMLEYLGTDGYIHVNEVDAVKQAFEEIALQIQKLASRFYLLSYCSPSRAGIHRLEVEAVHNDLRGSLSYDFDAEGFLPDCDPNQAPSFSVPGTKQQLKRRRPQRSKATSKSGATGEGTKKKAQKRTNNTVDLEIDVESEESQEAPPPATW